MTITAGEQFAQALAAKDATALRAVLADRIDFQALTPGRHWQAATGEQVVDDFILGKWFGPGDQINGLRSVTSSRVADRQHVAYQVEVGNAGGEFVVEQHAYYDVDEGRISWMRVLCSGYRLARLAAG